MKIIKVKNPKFTFTQTIEVPDDRLQEVLAQLPKGKGIKITVK